MTKEYVIKDLFGILVVASVNVINLVTGEFLDYKNCKCRNKIVDKLHEGCSKSIDGNEMLYNETLDAILLDAILLNDYEKVCNSYTIYIVLFAVFFITSICISGAFIYFHWYLEKDNVQFH